MRVSKSTNFTPPASIVQLFSRYDRQIIFEGSKPTASYLTETPEGLSCNDLICRE